MNNEINKSHEEILRKYIIRFPEDGCMTHEAIKRNVLKAMAEVAAMYVKNGFIEKAKLRQEVRDEFNNNVRVLSARNVELSKQLAAKDKEIEQLKAAISQMRF